MRIRTRDPGWEKIGTEIRDNPGSATLPLSLVWKAVEGTVAIVRGVLGNKCAGQHNLKTLRFKETIVLAYF
jgi:hypothetical protein